MLVSVHGLRESPTPKDFRHTLAWQIFIPKITDVDVDHEEELVECWIEMDLVDFSHC